MLEVLYRIYEVLPEDKQHCSDFGWSMSDRMSTELVMDIYCCETRNEFKDYIRDMYGKDIKFAFSSKYKPGQIYCIIIGEHLYGGSEDKYFMRLEFDCTNCGQHVKTFSKKLHRIRDWEIRSQLGNDLDKYADLPFCCDKCADEYTSKEHRAHYLDPNVTNEFVDINSWSYSGLAGYIYKISKKSTKEFYVGKTIYAPIFRWGQHLKSERFPIDEITDYKFEVLEIVPKDISLSEREDYWIHKCYDEDPEKSLNIANLQKDRRIAKEQSKYKTNILNKLTDNSNEEITDELDKIEHTE